MKHLLVTGASGYLGSAIVKELEISPISEKVTLAQHNSPIHHIPDRFSVVPFSQLVSGAFDLNAFDAVCHLGAYRGGNDNVVRVKSLADTSTFIGLISKTKIESLVFASTHAVYGLTHTPWLESSELAPVTDYAWSKIAGEEIVRLASSLSGLTRATSIRFPKLVGPGHAFRVNQGEILNAFCWAALKGEKLILPRDFLNQQFDFLDVRDAARLTVQFIGLPNTNWPTAVNVGKGHFITGDQLISSVNKIFSSMFGKEIDYVISDSKPFKPRNFGMNTDLLREHLGDLNCRPLEDTIADTLTHLASVKG